MHSINSFEVRPEEPETISWTALASSVVVHTLLMLWLVFRPTVGATTIPRPSESGQAAQPIALASPPKTRATQPTQPQPAPTPAPPLSPTRETPLGPDSKNPDALVPKEAGPVKPMTEPEPTPATPPADPEPPAEKAPDLVPPAPRVVRRIPRPGDYASANRLLSKPTSPWGSESPTPLDAPKGEGETALAAVPAITEGAMGRMGQSGRDARDWRPSFDEAAGRCVAIPDLGRNADGTPVLATVIGRVLDTDGRSPLIGAHLQIIGTAFSTFSDGNGEYRLEFDPRLLEKCRVQYVRVAADGYRGEMLTLAIGERVRSDDVVLKRH